MEMLRPIHKFIQSSPAMNRPRQLSFEFRSLVAREPALSLLYQPYLYWDLMKRDPARNTDPREHLLHSDTEIVIDGFQGSANSFAVRAFKQSQTQHVQVAHHMHSSGQTIRAIRQGIPVLLTIREPVDAALSLISRWSYVSTAQALQNYIGFYGKLRPFASHCVVSTFEQTTQNLDQVVQRLNTTFGTHFDLPDVAETSTSYLSIIKGRQGARKALKQKLREEITAEKNAHLLTEAKDLYQAFEAFAHGGETVLGVTK